jgi:ABC-type hemin transport system substrate-binding protein
MATILQDLFATQKNDINNLIVQHLRQQQLATPRLPKTNTSTKIPLPITTVAAPLVSPTSTLDIKQQYALKLARAHQYNQAFEVVLSASDLQLVLFLCEHVCPTDLFAIQPCPLQIPVLLSLIQQLAANLNTHQELKLK